MKNILITGGSGFIGKNLREQLQGKYNIYAPSHSELELLDYDAPCGGHNIMWAIGSALYLSDKM